MTPDGNQTVEPKSLVNQLEYFYKQFQFFGLDDGYIEQIFKQLLYYICVISINNLMLRQELCMWKTGMKIRYNVSCLEDWARKKKMVMRIKVQVRVHQSNLTMTFHFSRTIFCNLCNRWFKCHRCFNLANPKKMWTPFLSCVRIWQLLKCWG